MNPDKDLCCTSLRAIFQHKSSHFCLLPLPFSHTLPMIRPIKFNIRLCYMTSTNQEWLGNGGKLHVNIKGNFRLACVPGVNGRREVKNVSSPHLLFQARGQHSQYMYYDQNSCPIFDKNGLNSRA